MANLPDLVTTDIGIIAFWNAHDHRAVAGVGDANPTDCIPGFDSYSVYDNGIEGYKALGSGRYFHARVKSDGWMVAWIDRTNTFFYPDKEAGDFGESAHKGYYDVLWNWFQYTANLSNTETTLSYLIDQLYNQLSNKTDFSFAAADVGHYCYEYPNANVITLSDLRVGYITATKTGHIQYTTGTTLFYAACLASAYTYYYTPSYSEAEATFAGNNLITKYSENDKSKYAVADIISNNWMPNPLTDYSSYVYCYGSTGYKAYSHISLLIIWS